MIPIGLSTASVWPRRVEAGFRYAAELGYDGVEVMIWGDQDSQDEDALRRYSKRYGMPILSMHSPSLLITQRVFSADPAVRLRRTAELAMRLESPTVVVHPPFVWQWRYAKRFPELVRELAARTGVAIAVENMFPAKPMRGISVHAFHPSIDPTDVGYQHYTLDLSHTAAAGMNALELAARMGPGLRHIHLADGTGLPYDEHLIPGRGTQPCGELLDTLTETGFDGSVIIEVSTRADRADADRTTKLAEALLYTKLHLAR